MKKSIFFTNVYNCDEVKGDLDKMFSLLKECNVCGLQMAYDELISLDEVLFRDKLNKNGVEIVCTHITPRLTCEDDEIYSVALDECEAALETVKRFGCEFLMVVPFHMGDTKGVEDKSRARKRFAEALKVVVNKAEKHNVKVVVENISQTILPFSTTEDIEYLLSDVPGLHYCFDVGNFVCTKTDTLFAFERLKDKISLVHVKDFEICDETGYPCDSGIFVKHTDFGSGKAKLCDVMNRLLSENPTIPYIVEVHGEFHPMQHILDACNYTDSLFN